MNTHESERDGDILRADFVFDLVENLKSQGFGALNACARGRAQADLELAGFDPRENFRSKLAADEYDQRRA